MIKLQLLNSQASLNNFFVIGSIEYVPGEDVRIVIRLMNPQLNIRHIPDDAATLDFIFPLSDGTELVKAGTMLQIQDKSIWYVDLTPLESINLASSNFQIELTDDGVVSKSVLFNALAKNIISGSGNC